MATNKVVKAAATVNSQVDDDNLNPATQSTPALVARDKRIIHITLEVEGVAVTPDDIYDALDAQFPVVSSNKEVQTHGVYNFNIGPA